MECMVAYVFVMIAVALIVRGLSNRHSQWLVHDKHGTFFGPMSIESAKLCLETYYWVDYIVQYRGKDRGRRYYKGDVIE